MIQEEKELLLKDLCARLPYGVKVDVNFYDATKELSCDLLKDFIIDEKSVRPYLRPMSSMTEVEKHIFDTMTRGYTVCQQASLFDWLNKKMFDYRGLIEMGLALEALEGMYNLK